MQYYIDINATAPPFTLNPCTFVPSAVAGKTLLCRESDGASMVVEPDGSQVRWIEPGADNFDSLYTQGTVLSGHLVFRSAAGPNAPTPPQVLGVPRAYRMFL